MAENQTYYPTPFMYWLLPRWLFNMTEEGQIVNLRARATLLEKTCETLLKRNIELFEHQEKQNKLLSDRILELERKCNDMYDVD